MNNAHTRQWSKRKSRGRGFRCGNMPGSAFVWYRNRLRQTPHLVPIYPQRKAVGIKLKSANFLFLFACYCGGSSSFDKARSFTPAAAAIAKSRYRVAESRQRIVSLEGPIFRDTKKTSAQLSNGKCRSGPYWLPLRLLTGDISPHLDLIRVLIDSRLSSSYTRVNTVPSNRKGYALVHLLNFCCNLGTCFYKIMQQVSFSSSAYF